MTKDEAIDLEAESRAAIKFAEVHFRNEDEFTERDLMMVQAGWLAAKRSIARAPSSEAVAEKPQDDRAAASPAAPAFQDGAVGNTKAIHSAVLAIRHDPRYSPQQSHAFLTAIHAAAAAVARFATEAELEQWRMAGAAKGGITNDDDQQISAQGIDHAKRAFDGFMLWAGQHLGQGYRLEREDGTFLDPVTRWAFKAWQARGQQAGDRFNKGD